MQVKKSSLQRTMLLVFQKLNWLDSETITALEDTTLLFSTNILLAFLQKTLKLKLIQVEDEANLIDAVTYAFQHYDKKKIQSF